MKKIYVIQLEDTINAGGWLCFYSNKKLALEKYEFYRLDFLTSNGFFDEGSDVEATDFIREDYRECHCFSGNNGKTLFYKESTLDSSEKISLY